MTRIRAHLRDDRGVLAGADILLFGLVGVIFTSLVIMNAWLAVDTSLAVSAAAREGARAAVESADGPSARTNAETAMRNVMGQYGRDIPGNLNVDITFSNGFVRCQPVTANVGYRINLISLPLFGDLGSHTINATHTEIVDPFRSGTFTFDGAAGCP